MDQCSAYTWPAPAKLNLMLRILGRREDGYHTLQTVFQFLDYGDTLDFHIRTDGAITRSNPIAGLSPTQDISVEAAKRLQRLGRVSKGVEIHLHKRLPMGGGLGGGSSDAATTLLALNQLWQVGLSIDELAALGLDLGADVPVFIRGQAAWGEGIGELLTPLVLPEPWYVVLVPAVSVSTKAVFSNPALTRDSSRITIPRFLAGEYQNDCQAVVCAGYPEVAKAMDWLSGCSEARLTGTGACVYAEFQQRTQALAVLRQVPVAWKAFMAKGLNTSPCLLKKANIA